MNVASLELCQKLYELSGWEGERHPNHGYEDEQGSHIPYFTLGYLLRKLPTETSDPNGWLTIQPDEDPLWAAGYELIAAEGAHFLCIDTSPENAAARLAIHLFEQGVLVREGIE